MHMKINEILGNEYQDFLEFCSSWGKTYPDELSVSDFLAFRVQYGKSREYVEIIKSILKEGKTPDNNGINKSNDDEAADTELTNNDDRAPLESEAEEVGEVKSEDMHHSGLIADETTIDMDSTDPNTEEPHVIQGIGAYNTGLPLYLVLNVDISNPLLRISINELPVNLKIRRALKNCGITTIADALKSTISAMYACGTITENNIEGILNALRDFAIQDFRCIKYFMMQTEYPLSEILEIIDINQYEFASVNSIDLSVRFHNALVAHNIKSIKDLLCLSLREIFEWQNLGRTSIEESIDCLYKFLCDKNRKIVNTKGSNDIKNQKMMMARMFEFVKSSQVPDFSILSEQEKEIYYSIKNAVDDCGYELYDAVSSNPKYFALLAQSFSIFIEEQNQITQKRTEIAAAALTMPNQIMYSSAKLLSNAYYLKRPNTIKQFWDSISEECTVQDLFEEIRIKLRSRNELSHICKFLDWLNNLNLESALEDIFLRDALESGRNKVDDSFKDKYLNAIEMRAAGETLEGIGIKLGTTRERVRQIERKFTGIFANRYINSLYDVFAIIHALRGGDNVLTYDEVRGIIGDRYAQLLWLLLSKGLLDNNTYRYFKKYNSVIFTTNIDGEDEKINDAFDALPDYFIETEYDTIVDTIIQKHELHRELFEMFLDDHLQLNGIMYSKYTPTVIFMVGYVLKARFANGYKIAVSEESSRFREYMVEFFGEKGKKTARAIDAVVGQIGILIDRGKYVHTDYINIDKSIIDKVNAYVESNPKNVIPFSEIFEALEDVFAGTIITNRYILQGIIRKYGSPYTLARDYITKEKGKSLTDEFEDFAKEVGEFCKEDFYAAFPALNEMNLGMLIGRCKNVFNIDNGLYMHSSLLKLDDTDYNNIREFLLQACAANPISSRTLFDEFSYRFVEFIDRNDIGNHGKLFGVLYYMFADEFSFSRPYIAKIGTGQITNKIALLGYIGNRESVSIEEVIDTCTTNGIRFYSAWNLMRMLSPEYIRVNKDFLVKFSLTGISDVVIEKVIEILNEALEQKGYLSSSLISDFLFYPQINVSWNPYLVEAIVDYVGNRINCINIAMSGYEMYTHIFVTNQYSGMDYQQFILKILDDAFLNESFTNKREMREWLYERGLITTNGLPKFLEDNRFYFIDDNGRLCRSNS